MVLGHVVPGETQPLGELHKPDLCRVLFREGNARAALEVVPNAEIQLHAIPPAVPLVGLPLRAAGLKTCSYVRIVGLRRPESRSKDLQLHLQPGRAYSSP